jgi:hypothetical protein
MVLGVLFSLLVAMTPTGASSFISGIVDSINGFSSGTLQLKGTTPTSVNCFTTGTGTGGTVSANSSVCPGDLYPTTILSTTAASATSTLTANGTVSPTGGTLALASCGVQQLADKGTGADTGLAYGGLAFASPFTSASQGTFTDTGVTLDGNAVTSYVGTITSRTAPATFSLTAWIKTSTATGGVIMGMSNLQPNTATATLVDRMLFVNSSGRVVFNMYNSSSTKIQATSVGTVTNGAWHFVAATYSTATGLNLYVDGGAAVNTANGTNNAYAGAYWHLGWNPTTGWTGAPTSAAWNGSLYGLSVIPSVLSAASVTTLYNQTSAANYSTAIVTTFAATNFWPLNDTGTVLYTGNIPALGSSACPLAQVSVQETRGASITCLYPNGGAACATFAAVSSLGTQTIALPPTTSSATSILVSARVAATPAAGVIYLHVVPVLGFTTSASSWSATLSYNVGFLEL